MGNRVRLRHKIHELRNSPLTGKSIGVLFLRVLGVLLFFSLTLFLTNNFDPVEVGKYDFSRSLLIFLGTLAVFGMQQSIIYYSGFLMAKEQLGAIKSVYFRMVSVVLGISILLVLGTLLLKTSLIEKWLGYPIPGMVLKTVWAIFFYGVTMLNIDAFRAIHKIYLSEVFRNIFRYLFFFIAVIVLFYGENSTWLVEAYLLNFAFLAIISTLVLWRQFGKASLQWQEGFLRISHKEILKRSAPMAVSAASFLLMQSLDVLMLTSFTDYETVAFYSAAVKLTLLISIVLSSVNAVIAPQIAKDFASSKLEALKKNIKRSTRLIMLMTLPLILILALFSSFVLHFFGASYVSANTALLILLMGQAVNAFCGSIGVYLNMTGKQQVFQVVLLSALGVNVVLNYFLIPKFGMTGAAIATSVSMILWNAAAVLYVYQKDGVKTFLS
ncbi:MAG: flippase [Flavobacteriaceae bacterium]